MEAGLSDPEAAAEDLLLAESLLEIRHAISGLESHNMISLGVLLFSFARTARRLNKASEGVLRFADSLQQRVGYAQERLAEPMAEGWLRKEGAMGERFRPRYACLVPLPRPASGGSTPRARPRTRTARCWSSSSRSRQATAAGRLSGRTGR